MDLIFMNDYLLMHRVYFIKTEKGHAFASSKLRV